MLSVSGLESRPMVEAGKLVFLNIWTAKRNPKIPDVPTLKELGYPYVFESPYGIAGPKGIDPKIVEKLQNAYKKALDDPAVITLMDRYEICAATSSPAPSTPSSWPTTWCPRRRI